MWMPKLAISRAYSRSKATFTLGTLTCPNRVPWGTKVQTTLSKTHVGIFFVFTVCASAGYKKINMKKKWRWPCWERLFCLRSKSRKKKIRFKILKFSACVLEYMLISCQFFCTLKLSSVGVCQIKLPQQEPSFRWREPVQKWQISLEWKENKAF